MKKITKLILVNSITLIRIIGIILILSCYKYGGLVVGLMTIGIYFSDVLDGYLARKWKCATFFGALFDGLADKLFTIVNFIVLYMIIKDLALIPIVIELLICIVQLIKFAFNMNIKSNLIGKSKVWVLAICIVLTYFASDINSITILGDNFISFINSIDKELLYRYTLGPAIIFEVISLLSYILEVLFKRNIEATMKERKHSGRIKLNNKTRSKYLMNVWFSPEFYEKHKDETNLRDLRIESKKKIV